MNLFFSMLAISTVFAMTAIAVADTEKEKEDRKVFAVAVNALGALQYRRLFEYFHIGIGASFALSVWTRGQRLLDDGSTKTKRYDPMTMPQLNLEIGFAL